MQILLFTIVLVEIYLENSLVHIGILLLLTITQREVMTSFLLEKPIFTPFRAVGKGVECESYLFSVGRLIPTYASVCTVSLNLDDSQK